ncbi:MAG: hypothetical protein D4R39_00915 [Methylophilaceae bacterium]|nr:MAG: hypothetical protein D4R39_00915 [Methylophilaceae bacterium]
MKTQNELGWMQNAGITTKYAGDDPESEYSKLRDRIKLAIEKIQPGAGVIIGKMSGAEARAFVNEVCNANIQNDDVLVVMRQIVEALEAK